MRGRDQNPGQRVCNILVVSDSAGQRLWRGGPDMEFRRVGRLGFARAIWEAWEVGANAVGTALVTRGALKCPLWSTSRTLHSVISLLIVNSPTAHRFVQGLGRSYVWFDA